MQMLVEGVAMGAFATLHVKARDPLLRRLCQLTMTDEAFHHKFGKIWAHATIPKLPEEQAIEVEDWALECFQMLLFNLVNPEQKRVIYPKLGLDWQWVRERGDGGVHGRGPPPSDAAVDGRLPHADQDAAEGRHHHRANAPRYAAWVDMHELAAEGDAMVGDDIAEEGIRYLREINAGKRKIVKRISESA